MENKTIESISDLENLEKSKIVIKKATEAPEKDKENPFYDEECWGQTKSPENIYLPDSDEAISFAVAAHEIGHLSKEGAVSKEEIAIDNFEATKVEEQRAWTIGKRYLSKYLSEYSNEDYDADSIMKVIDDIEIGMMEIVDWSCNMYLPQGALEGLDNKEKEEKLRVQREKFAADKLEEYKKLVEEKVKSHKVGRRADWEKFTAIVRRAVVDILEDNKKIK